MKGGIQIKSHPTSHACTLNEKVYQAWDDECLVILFWATIEPGHVEIEGT